MNYQGEVMDRKSNRNTPRPAYHPLAFAIALVLDRWPHYTIGGKHA